MAPGRRSFRPLAASLLALTVIAGTGPAALAVGSDASAPSLRLIAPKTSVTVRRQSEGPAYLTPGILVAATRGAWDIRAARPDYDSAVT
ncbi:MAG: hypothetical protein WKF46_08470, partial [Candidatus Limnocylindrales bacterium]